MSHERRPRLTRMLICDLCNEEIPEQEWSNGMSRANVMSYISPAPGKVTNRTIWALLSWRGGLNRQTGEREKSVSYDFHGKCIVALVEKAVTERKETDAEAHA